MSLYDEVYGLKYKAAEDAASLLQAAMKNQLNVGFNSKEELEQWAHDHHLDKVLFSNMSHQFMCISHKGEIMLPKQFENYYKNLLFYEEKHGSKVSSVGWHPDGFEFFDNAYIAGEQSDGVHKPLYYRDYTVPTGFYSESRDAFNVAKPFPVFAQETGRDTTHIYQYIEHIAGDCAYHLLAWLRAKLLYPTTKTQVVPIIVSRTQGSGKTTFAEVICKGLFGKDNVLVSDQYDSSARFNADYADSLIVCLEEKEETDKRNTAGALKSRATATTIRKEQKGIDPIYQDSYTDFIMTTNKDVPIKFDGREDQRRFMIMESDPNFTRKTSALADEVFTKLYGYDTNYNRRGVPFVEDRELIAQFKHELFSRADIADVELRNFPKTAAYKKCFTLPRTSEATEIESILRALAPFIKASLEQKKAVTEIGDSKLTDIIQYPGAMQYMPAFKEHVAYVALCRPLIFYEMQSMKPMPHSTVERGIYDCAMWLAEEYNIHLIPDMDPLPGGFTNVAGRYKVAACAKFSIDDPSLMEYNNKVKKPSMSGMFKQQFTAPRQGKCLRVNKYFKPDEHGCFETVNEMRPGVDTLQGNKTANVLYMDTFLLESDTPTGQQLAVEKKRAQDIIDKFGEGYEVQASELYKERLEYALEESKKLFNEGKVLRVVYSGAKSYHLLVRVEDAPKNIEEYRWLHAYLSTTISDKLIFDDSTSDPARLTRSPITLDRVSSAYNLLVMGEQKLICGNPTHIYKIDWRPIYEQWLGRPLKKYEQKQGKPLYPTRPEYKEALEAIISGEFWSSSKFDGQRQQLFFPAYRLLRVLGYSHTEAWENVIEPHLSDYKKQNEIVYWKSRKDSAIITKIDREIDEYNEQWEEKQDANA